MKLNLSHISKSFGSDDVLRDASLQIKNREKVALIGRNGSGKTTLLKIISNQEDPDKGTVYVDPGVRIGYLSQISFPDESKTVQQELLSVFTPLLELEEKMAEQAVLLQDDPSEKNLEEYDRLQNEYERLGGYEYETELKSVFFHFGFELEDLAKPLSEFSSGQRTRIALVKLLLTKPDILLLDEPTNHLDIDSIEWLENYIRHYPSAVILVCHDRTFIDHVADEIVEIEFGKSNRYVGNYHAYLEQKKKEIERNHEAYLRQQEEIARLQALIERFKAKASKAAFAKSREKILDRMELIEDRRADTSQIKASFSSWRKGGHEVMEVENLQAGYDTPLSNSSFKLYRGDRLAIVGPNGIGKSTLIKTIAGLLPKLGGKVQFGHQIDLGYFDQDTAHQSSSRTVLDELWDSNPDSDQTEVRNVLASFLFRGEDVFKSLDTLSGGEKVRLALAKLMMDHDNLLLLDEPTNHLDIPSKEALENALQEFDGTVLFVSHDRWFLDKMATSILETGEQSKLYDKTSYQEYLQKKQQPEEVQQKVKVQSQSELQQKRKAAKNRIQKLESLLEQEEELLKKEEQLRFEPEYYSDFQKMEELEKQMKERQEQIEAYMQEWEEKTIWLDQNS